MNKEIYAPTIIANLDINQVTWAPSYCSAAKEEGLVVRGWPAETDIATLFIGDQIEPTMLSRKQPSIYMLAAVEGTEVESNNIEQTTRTIVASKPELAKILQYFPNIDKNKVIINGFPINSRRLISFALPWDVKRTQSVCFLGESREIKNPQFELVVVERLRKMGYFCTHLSPRDITIKEQLQELGCRTIEGIRGDSYYREVAETQFVINTSWSESLYISGIEAFLLGTVPIVPNQPHSGFSEWCSDSLMYDYPSVDAICNIIEKYAKCGHPRPHLEWFSQEQYFHRLKQLTGDIL